VASDFVQALTNVFVNFLFAYAANKSILVNYDVMQIRWAVK